MEPSLVNNCVNYRDVQVTKLANQKLITLFTERRKDVQPSDWQFLVNKLKSYNDAESSELAKTIQSFCQDYEQTVFAELRREDSNGQNESQSSKVDTRKTKLMENHPSICFTSVLNGQNDGLTEISINQKFLSEIGYSTDSFASTVLQEGIPQLMPYDSNVTESMAKILMGNFSAARQEGFKTSEFEAPLLLKSGYVKSVKIQMNLFFKKEKSGVVMDVILTILSKKTPFFQEKALESCLNSDFLHTMNFKEKEMAQFFSMYYNESPTLRYTNMNKVCRVMEVTGDDSDDE